MSSSGRVLFMMGASLLTCALTVSAQLYCTVDIAGGKGAASFAVQHYATAAEVPQGVTSECYKTTHLLLRRIDPTPSEGFMMGSPGKESRRVGGREKQVKVVLTKPYWMGVYQVTQKQWELVTGTRPAAFKNEKFWEKRPVESISYYQLRESGQYDSGSATYTWPERGEAVAPDSFMGILRAKTSGALQFDLPTEAQWEWACRAGTTGGNNLVAEPKVTIKQLARYRQNAGFEDGGRGRPIVVEVGAEHGTAYVGSYLPNAWGLYDMLGNVWEWCRDGAKDVLPGGVDPVGASGSDYRVLRGGSWANSAADSRSASRIYFEPSARYHYLGARVAADVGL